MTVATAEDVSRYEAGIALLRLLAEGLALFAEFDATPSTSPIVSKLMFVVMAMFGTPATTEADSRDWSKEIRTFLGKQRLGNGYRERKANLLVQPLGIHQGGYLPGYLTVKNLRYRLISRMKSSKFSDTDLYLMYLKDFFYADFGFVATLLDDETRMEAYTIGSHNSLETISIYFQNRLQQLVDWTTEATVDRFEASNLGGRSSYEPGMELATDPVVGELGRQRLRKLLDELASDGVAEDLDRTMRQTDQWILARRHLMCIGSFKERVRVNENHRVLVGEYKGNTGDIHFPVCALSALPDVPVGAGPGSLECFLSPAEMYSAMTVSLDGRIVAIVPTGDNPSAEVKERIYEIAAFRASPEAVAGQHDLFMAVVDEVLSHDSEGMIYLKHGRDNIARVSDGVYSEHALLLASQAKRERCRVAMRERGLYKVLDENAELVRSVALLSLIGTINLPRNFAAEVFRAQGEDLETVLATLRERYAERGLPVIEEVTESTGKIVFSFV